MQESFSDPDFSIDAGSELDSTQMEQYSRSMVNVSKRVMAKYFIIHKCVCSFMIWIHLSMAVISVGAMHKRSIVHSESRMCKYTFYASHYLYSYINIFIILLYLHLLLSFKPSSLSNLSLLPNTDHIFLLFFSLVMYVMILKVIADINCTFWGVTAREMVFQGLQFTLEGIAIKFFYHWILEKVTSLRTAIEDNIDMERADEYLPKQ